MGRARLPRSQPVITTLAGGVGAAKFLRGLARCVPANRLGVVVNTGDDEEFYGLHVSPDIDTVIYTLAGTVNPATGWGVAGDTFVVGEALSHFYGKPWFALGDRDLATHLYRTDLLRRGASLAEVTGAVARRFGVKANIMPMSNDRVRTFVKLRGAGSLPFQEYFVRRRFRGKVEAIELRGARAARPLAAALTSVRQAAAIVMAPSNPFVSLGPILALPGFRQALREARERVAAISPIVGGRTIKGPADRMLRGLGHEVSALGVARLYKDVAATFVLDRVDAAMAPGIERLGMRAVVADTIMSDPERAAALAKVVLSTLKVYA